LLPGYEHHATSPKIRHSPSAAADSNNTKQLDVCSAVHRPGPDQAGLLGAERCLAVVLDIVQERIGEVLVEAQEAKVAVVDFAEDVADDAESGFGDDDPRAGDVEDVGDVTEHIVAQLVLDLLDHLADVPGGIAGMAQIDLGAEGVVGGELAFEDDEAVGVVALGGEVQLVVGLRGEAHGLVRKDTHDHLVLVGGMFGEEDKVEVPALFGAVHGQGFKFEAYGCHNRMGK
jgi:hypothetical protein